MRHSIDKTQRRAVIRSCSILLAFFLICLIGLYITGLDQWVKFYIGGYSGDGVLITDSNGNYPKYKVQLPALKQTTPVSMSPFRVYGATLFTSVKHELIGEYRLTGIPPCQMLIAIECLDKYSGELITGYDEIASRVGAMDGSLTIEVKDAHGRPCARRSIPFSQWTLARSSHDFYIWDRALEARYDPSQVYTLSIVAELPADLSGEVEFRPFLIGGGSETL